MPVAAVEGTVSYNFEVRPILASKCFSCHGSDPRNRKGDLRLDTFADATAFAINPGKPDESEVLLRVLSTDPDEVMP
ncbi:MAG: c-type cytochrome domain-containing protein, partial [Verrucomicrobiaceae bacterium]